MTIVKISQSKNNQFRMTFPKKVANMIRLKDNDKIEFLFLNGEIVIRKV